MTFRRVLFATVLPLALSACATVDRMAPSQLASATLRNAGGTVVGTARLVEIGGSMRLIVAATSLSPGAHGIHLHAFGLCEAAGFASAGGHLNPSGKQHGRDNPAGSHLGDLPNLTVESGGAGALEVAIPGDRASLEASLFDSDGTALVIHAAPDDYRTDPSGNSGARIACGAFKRG